MESDVYARLYRRLTKKELFWVAMAHYQLTFGEDVDLDGFVRFVRSEARLWGG